MSALDDLPLGELEAVFLDIGGTLTAMDFRRIAAELEGRGTRCPPEVLARAEAAARPNVSARLADTRPLEDGGAFALFLRTIFAKVPAAHGVDPGLAREIAPGLFEPGESGMLWSWVLPGTVAGLTALRELGLKLVAVSNSDGTAERGLEAVGLTRFFDGVVDSHLVGAAKPDPAIFDHAFALASVERSRALHVGDMYFADVVGARRAGVEVVLVDPYGDWGEPDCATVPDVLALADAIREAR